MKLESHIKSMGFMCGADKALGSLTIMSTFCGVLLLRFLWIGHRAFIDGDSDLSLTLEVWDSGVGL